MFGYMIFYIDRCIAGYMDDSVDRQLNRQDVLSSLSHHFLTNKFRRFRQVVIVQFVNDYIKHVDLEGSSDKFKHALFFWQEINKKYVF